jgi:hypothetical protein
MSGYTSGKVSRDPMPFSSASGTRFAYPFSTRPIDGLTYAPRPEFDHHNPILEGLRKFDWDVTLTLDALAHEPDWRSQFAPLQIAHARRVLEKLAAFEAVSHD